MSSVAETNKRSVIKFAQEFLLREKDKSAITPSLIAEKVISVLAMFPDWGEGLDHIEVTEELIRRFSIWIGQDVTLSSDEGHIPWLTTERKNNWRYWQRYREWQEAKLPWSAVEGLNSSTDHVLGMLEDPLRDGAWDRRGLVVGHVQSGKTGNYTGLICKAADAGYKIIIVLAGLHNNLRSQTQMRLDEGFLGYETNASSDNLRIIGVGEIDSDMAIRPNYATNRSEKGDFSTKAAKNMGISPEQRPWLFVVKKNKTVLKRLFEWINNHVANGIDPDTGRKIVTHLPILIIDDEADHASVDTGERPVDEDGNPDFEHEPTAINQLIRKILHTFSRKAYVGYTATPFANIFIHERGETKEEGPDVFPSSFIINLAAPSNYVGPARVFGLRTGDAREDGLPLIRHVKDQCSEDGATGWMPVKHKNHHKPTHPSEAGLPPSLVEAIDSFIVTCAVRLLRGQGSEHSSMLVHVTRFNSTQKDVHKSIDAYVQHVKQRLNRRIGHEIIVSRFQSLWVNNFLPTTHKIRALIPDAVTTKDFSWHEIEEVLVPILDQITVKMINGTAKDALDYADSPEALKVIAIGGDKLARGLTLEGLCISYFLRASRMYDTLMQMGRWFGYRPGYLDLCRLYTTSDLVEWFEHIADASEELREEFDLMAASSASPKEYGLKVQSHPVLMVTSRVKMRASKSLFLSFSGSVVETVTFSTEKSILENNRKAFSALVSQLGNPQEIPKKNRGTSIERINGVWWEQVPYAAVTSFLGSYKTHPEALKVHSQLLRDFIDSMANSGELTQWTVAVLSGGENATWEFGKNLTVDGTKRKARENVSDRYAIRRLLSPNHEAIDLNEAAWTAALEETIKNWHPDPARDESALPPKIPNGPSLRLIRGFGAPGVEAHPERGLLLIYLLDPIASEITPSVGVDPIVAFGISFPGSHSGTKVKYEVNNVLWEQEYAAAY